MEAPGLPGHNERGNDGWRVQVTLSTRHTSGQGTKTYRMEVPKLVAVLIASDSYGLAVNAFRRKANEDRYIAPCEVEDSSTFSSREATPALGAVVDERSDKYGSAHRLVLDLEKKVKNPARGFCFGANPNICDIVLGNRRHGISSIHFYISFATLKGVRRLILRDVSTLGTAVAFSRQAGNEVRRDFVWILDLDKEEGRWQLEVCVGELQFQIELATHTTCAKEHKMEVNEFLARQPTVDGLAIYTPTESVSPKPGSRAPIYISERELGRGSFGSVEKVTDVSTGEIYARKTFFQPQWERSESRKAQQRGEWLERVHREIRIMTESRHENVVGVVYHRLEYPPFLVMPYFALGNLHDQHGESVISKFEAVDLLRQVLEALKYLHERGVAHRDLKPENILVASRTPLSLKLADFGLANDKSIMETVCGTRKYIAPEVYQGSRYTTAVDLWSLGVIVLDYVYGLPSMDLQIPQKRPEEWGIAWCSRVADHANDIDSDMLLDFLKAGMLQIVPDGRLSADACLAVGHDCRLFDHDALDSGTVTPRQNPAVEAGPSESADPTTIALNALWDTEDEIAHRDEQIGPRRSLGSSSARAGGSQRMQSAAPSSANRSSGTQVRRLPREDGARRETSVEAVDDGTAKTAGSSSSGAGEHGITYPSALLDDTNVSGCSIP